MFNVASTQFLTETSTARVSANPPERASTMPLGLIATRGLRSLPEVKRAENEPAWNTLSGADDITNVVSGMALEAISRVATVVLSLRVTDIVAAV